MARKFGLIWRFGCLGKKNHQIYSANIKPRGTSQLATQVLGMHIMHCISNCILPRECDVGDSSLSLQKEICVANKSMRREQTTALHAPR